MTEQVDINNKNPITYSETEKQTLPMPNETDLSNIGAHTKLSLAIQKAKHRFLSKGR